MSANHLCLFIPILLSISSNGNEHLPGHLQPLGLQTPPVGGVLTVNNIPSPEEFFYQFVKPGKPVLFKGAASKTPAYQQWTDNYLSSKFGELKFDVEEGKKENRSKGVFNLSLDEFVKSYQERDIYMVASVPEKMRDDIYLLKCLLCGGFTDELQDSVMWFSNGGTKSVLHYDAIDNINCLMSGTKELFMVDKREHAHIDIDNPEGSFCNVDVDKVDLQKYPGLANVPWYKANMEPGDCLFIPYRWFHQVRSFGPRNLAINIWFAHRLTFNMSDCENSSYKDKEFAPLSAFRVTENLGPGLSALLVDDMEQKPVDEKEFLKIIQNLWPNKRLITEGREMLKDIFRELDKNKNNLISPEEVMVSELDEYEQEIMELFPHDEEDSGEESDRSDDADDSWEDDGKGTNEDYGSADEKNNDKPDPDISRREDL